jgi:hypothetical protein
MFGLSQVTKQESAQRAAFGIALPCLQESRRRGASPGLQGSSPSWQAMGPWHGIRAVASTVRHASGVQWPLVP